VTKEIRFRLPDEVYELFEQRSLSDNVNKFAREMALHGLSAAYGILDDDETAKKIDAVIEKLS